MGGGKSFMGGGQWDNGTGTMGTMGTMGQWDNGTMGQWDNGTMGLGPGGPRGQGGQGVRTLSFFGEERRKGETEKGKGKKKAGSLKLDKS